MKTSQSNRESTIRDVAARANVAVGTVSRYLNGYTLREKNRKRIEEAIRELGYKENLIAKGMKTRKTHAIGALVAGYDEYHMSVIKVLERQITQRGYTLVVCDHENDRQILEQRLNFLLHRRVDGLLLSPSPVDPDLLRKYQYAGIPVILFNNDLPGIEADRIFVDNEEASFRAVEYLILMNHHKIAIINGKPEDSTAIQRLAGYKRAHHNYNISLHEQYITAGDWKEHSGYFAAKRMMDLTHMPTAFFVSNFWMTFGVLQALKEANLRIPEDISLISFDDVDAFRVYRPGITTVAQPTEQMGEIIVDVLFRRLEGENNGPYHTRLPCTIIVRDSVKKL
ncbi:MAG: LacI family transcriptional regulator [Spirochaetes bacterium]|nr:MAG: LacI family transcriptional regulator [Spirochaetota bacterium]